jgi:hypothetical protein
MGYNLKSRVVIITGVAPGSAGQPACSPPRRIITAASKGLNSYPRLDSEFNNLNGPRKFHLQHAYDH